MTTRSRDADVSFVQETLHHGSCPSTDLFRSLCFYAFVAIALCLPCADAIQAPSSNCYTFDNNSYLYDFTDWIGHPFEYEGNGKEADLVVRFCKDIESRSQAGYVDFGRYAASHYFVAGSGSVNFVQSFFNGDLANCEYSYDKMGRTAQLNIICGGCSNGKCKGDLGCICNVSYDKMTCSFGAEQTSVSLYLTAISSLSGLVGKPNFEVNPNEGLEVKLLGSGASGNPPTTLSPSVLIIDWRCEKVREAPYTVNISIPVEGYEPVEFTLTKSCAYRQAQEGGSMRGWATFGVISCIAIILSTLSCCGGFIYKSRVENQRGIDALPGMTILSACLEAISGSRHHPLGGDDASRNFINERTWERASTSGQGTQRTTVQGTQRTNGRYGSI